LRRIQAAPEEREEGVPVMKTIANRAAIDIAFCTAALRPLFTSTPLTA
jgi:hypothetical protein